MERAWFVAWLVLLTPVAAATGAPISAQLTLHTPPTFDASVEFASSHAGVDLALASGLGAPLNLSWKNATGHIHTSEWIVSATNVSLPDRTSEEFRVPPGRLTQLACSAGCQVLLFTDPKATRDVDRGLVSIDASVRGQTERTDQITTYWAEFASGNEGTFLHTFGAGTTRFGADSSTLATGSVAAEGTLYLFARDVLLNTDLEEATERDIDLRDHEEPVVAPLGVAATRVTSRWLLLRLENVTLASDLDALGVWMQSYDAVSRGRILFSDASGEATVGGVRHNLDRAPMTTAGSFNLIASAVATGETEVLAPSRVTQSARIGGEASEVWIDGRLVTAEPSNDAIARGSIIAAVLGLLLIAARLALPLYSRISRDRVLANPNRRAIWSHISSAPGASVTDIANACGLSRVVVRHHLATLSAHGLVSTRSEGRRRCHYAMGDLPTEHETALRAVLSNPRRAAIAALILDAMTPPTQEEAAVAARCSPRLASYHLARLEREGLVAGEGSWRRTYQPTPRLRAAMAARSETNRPETG